MFGEYAKDRSREPVEALAPRRSAGVFADDNGGQIDDFFAGDTPAPANASGLSVAHVLRYKWTIILVALLVSAAALAGIWTIVEPSYTASAIIEVHPTKQVVAFSTEENGVVPFYQQFLTTQMLKITSPKVIRRVLEREDVRQSEWLYGHANTLLGRLLGPSTPAGKLMAAVEVDAQRGSSLIEVSVNAPNPRDTALLANTIVDEYLTQMLTERVEQNATLNQQRLEREAALLEEIQTLEREAEEYKSRLKVLTPGEIVTARRLRLDELLAQRDALDLDLKNARATLQALEARQTQTVPGEYSPDEPGAGGSYASDATWLTMYDALQELRLELDIASSSFGKAHPEVVRLNKQIAALNRRIQKRERALDTAPPLAAKPVVVADSRSVGVYPSPEAQRWRVAELENRLTNLNELIARQSGAFDSTFGHAEALDKKLREVEYKRELYEAVKRKRDTRDIERFAPAAIEKEAVAMAPDSPNKDPRGKLSAIALFGAIAAGIAVACGRVMLSSTVREPAELAGTGSPFLGMLPWLKDPEHPEPLESATMSERVRMVRTSLFQRLGRDTGNVVQITSAGPGAGKSFFSVLLARSVAQSGKSVLLVDADLRNPSVARRLGIDTISQGLVQSLADETADEHTIMQTTLAGLSVLPAGRPAGHDQLELLSNGPATACLDRWRERYDFVLLDCSPLLPVADARILARHVDGTILLAREGNCRRDDVVEALACMTTSGGTLLGTVLVGTHGTSRYAYGYYGDYVTAATSETSVLDVRD